MSIETLQTTTCDGCGADITKSASLAMRMLALMDGRNTRHLQQSGSDLHACSVACGRALFEKVYAVKFKLPAESILRPPVAPSGETAAPAVAIIGPEKPVPPATPRVDFGALAPGSTGARR